MKFLNDVKRKRFKCIQCREYAKIVVLEDIELAWCETFECTNTSTMIKKGKKWVEHAHEDIYDIDIIQGMLRKSLTASAKAHQVRDMHYEDSPFPAPLHAHPHRET
jgi:hypothetical protein